MNQNTPAELVERIRRTARCVYLATDKTVADDIADCLNKAADALTATPPAPPVATPALAIPRMTPCRPLRPPVTIEVAGRGGIAIVNCDGSYPSAENILAALNEQPVAPISVAPCGEEDKRRLDWLEKNPDPVFGSSYEPATGKRRWWVADCGYYPTLRQAIDQAMQQSAAATPAGTLAGRDL